MKYLTLEDIKAQKPHVWRTMGNTLQVNRLTQILQPGVKYPIIFSMPNNDGPTVRLSVATADGSTFQLDVPFRMFSSLPEVDKEG